MLPLLLFVPQEAVSPIVAGILFLGIIFRWMKYGSREVKDGF